MVHGVAGITTPLGVLVTTIRRVVLIGVKPAGYAIADNVDVVDRRSTGCTPPGAATVAGAEPYSGSDTAAAATAGGSMVDLGSVAAAAAVGEEAAAGMSRFGKGGRAFGDAAPCCTRVATAACCAAAADDVGDWVVTLKEAPGEPRGDAQEGA